MSRTLTDHESIRRWAEEHGASPACVRGTGGGSDVGMLRLDFEGYSGADSLSQISWDDWFRKFDESHLALIVDDSGRTPNFNKLVSQDTARGKDQRKASQADTDGDEFESDDDEEFEGDEDDEEDEQE